jgi:redox-sensitive bicupin YhaK (pirin superfamily)
MSQSQSQSQHRRIARVVTVPPPTTGFIGPGHLASQVLGTADFALTDPFIMLADDRLDIGERQLGAPHPHAGFETVTLLLDGEIYDRDEGGVIKAGEVQWMTAGKGIIHSENVATRGKVRLLQLWLTLPKARRWMPPAFQDVHTDAVPVRREPGVAIRIYSGASGHARSSTRNQVPVTIAELLMDPGASVDQDVPVSYNGFVYVLQGSVRIGEDARLLTADQTGWLDRPEGDGPSVLRFTAGDDGARVVLYAGQPQGDAIVSHGPFIGDSNEDIARLYAEYRAGRFARMSELARLRSVIASSRTGAV